MTWQTLRADAVNKVTTATNWAVAQATRGYVAVTPVKAQNYIHGRVEAVKGQFDPANRSELVIKAVDYTLTFISSVVMFAPTAVLFAAGVVDAVATRNAHAKKVHDKVTAPFQGLRNQYRLHVVGLVATMVSRPVVLLVGSAISGHRFAKALGV
jgi:hypothetical protein